LNPEAHGITKRTIRAATLQRLAQSLQTSLPDSD
jgi:hypothetical protein